MVLFLFCRNSKGIKGRLKETQKPLLMARPRILEQNELMRLVPIDVYTFVYLMWKQGSNGNSIEKEIHIEIAQYMVKSIHVVVRSMDLQSFVKFVRSDWGWLLDGQVFLVDFSLVYTLQAWSWLRPWLFSCETFTFVVWTYSLWLRNFSGLHIETV